MRDRPLTGDAAALYIGAWMRSAEPGRRGLNASRIRADALAAARNTLARGRLRLAASRFAFARRAVRVETGHASVSREHRPRARRGTARARAKPRRRGAA